MNPHKKNKIDVSKLSEEEQAVFRKYGTLPPLKNKNLLANKQTDRKYFDSGDYAMSKAGVASAQAPGTAIPTPEGVPHASPPTPGMPGSLSSSPTGGSYSNTGSYPTNSPLPPAFADKPQSPERSPTSTPQGVGVGISPAAKSEAMDMPTRHGRRPSETSRVSPPGTLREGFPSSSFPIQHPGGFGSSPVKSSNLGKQLDQEMAE